MNCETFNSILFNRAHGEDNGIHKALQAHAEGCAACSAQMAAQEKLTSGLQTLRSATLDACAPATLEARLIESFRRQSCVAVEAATVHAPQHTPAHTAAQINSANNNSQIASIWSGASRFINERRYAFLPVAAAATILLAVASLAMIAQRESGAPSQSEISGVVQSGNSNTKSNAATNPLPDDTRPTFYGSREAKPVKFHQAAQPARGVRPRFVNERRRAQPFAPRISEIDESETTTEVATEFLPLVDNESLAAMEGGQVVRVEMSRQALVSMGLPMNNERADEPVKADVLMGDDGLARAIRFVR